MEQVQAAIRELTGAINAQIEYSKKLEYRLTVLEKSEPKKGTEVEKEELPGPTNEQDLKDISRLPDCVKELPEFHGNPTHYLSWVHNVENILEDYKIVKNKPLYRAIIQHIRQKVRGCADTALISYNIFGEDWCAIKKCLSLHYADKRDLRTLEHQMGQLFQGNLRVEDFYAMVNQQLSLIINKIKTEDYSAETVQVLIETYRDKALDVFVRGLRRDLATMLIIQKPHTLPEAYTACLEIQNISYRNAPTPRRMMTNMPTPPQRQPLNTYNQTYVQKQIPNRTLPVRQMNDVYNTLHNQQIQPPPVPTQPKPAVPMDIDRSIQSRQANYINRPRIDFAVRRDNQSDNNIRKQQRMFNLEPKEEDTSYHSDDEQNYYNQYEMEGADLLEQEEISDVFEANFMTDASPVYLT